jgi:UDP-galactopyranose mutase
MGGEDAPDILCLSHLRWNFVVQRPQHVMSRLARHHRVFFVEEPQFDDRPDHLAISEVAEGVKVVVPVLANDHPGHVTTAQRALIDRLILRERISRYVLWYYTPMALPFTRQLEPLAVVYDCMDELTGFAGASPELKMLERELLSRAELVTAGGPSLYEAKRAFHHNVHPFPSSIDTAHFSRARTLATEEPLDQAAIPHPRIGFAGVIDERMDAPLLAELADRQPDWQLVMLGPIVKIDPARLPRLPNVHYLGLKPYMALPDYMAGWDVGMLPFAHNEATRFISPTKTPEYLAAGLPVVATSITDVVGLYGNCGLVRIADGSDAFAAAIEAALGEGRGARLAEVDELLGRGSWDSTVARMRELMLRAVADQGAAAASDAGEPVTAESP